MKRIVVAGAGTMGSSIAQIFARKGYEVTLYDVSEKALVLAKEKITENIKTDTGKTTGWSTSSTTIFIS